MSSSTFFFLFLHFIGRQLNQFPVVVVVDVDDRQESFALIGSCVVFGVEHK